MTAVGRCPLCLFLFPNAPLCVCVCVCLLSVGERAKLTVLFFFNLCKITSDSTVFLSLLLTKGRNMMK